MTPDFRLLDKSLEEDFMYKLTASLEFQIMNDPAWAAPSDISHLSPADRRNPDIMDNVAAIAATNRLISWFGVDNEGYVGYWRSPKGTALAKAPVVQLDSEGQYTLVAASIPDYLALSVSNQDFGATRKHLMSVGFTVSATRQAALKLLDGLSDPNAYRNEVYNQLRKKRGLEPV